jgi:hypothetical protein
MTSVELSLARSISIRLRSRRFYIQKSRTSDGLSVSLPVLNPLTRSRLGEQRPGPTGVARDPMDATFLMEPLRETECTWGTPGSRRSCLVAGGSMECRATCRAPGTSYRVPGFRSRMDRRGEHGQADGDHHGDDRPLIRGWWVKR